MKSIQRMYVFAKTENERTRFWASISSPIMSDGEKTGQYARTEIPVVMSKEAKEEYLEKCKDTKNKAINMANVEVYKMWLNARQGKKGEKDTLCLFIDQLEVIE